MNVLMKVFVLLLFSAILICSFAALPKALAAESSALATDGLAPQNISVPSGSTASQKALSMMSSVVGLDTTKYNVTQNVYPNDSYQDILPRENMRCILDSGGSKVDALCTFINGSLQTIEVLDNEGSPQLTTPIVSVVGMAQSFLSKYQAQTKNSLYGELNLMLANVDVNSNATTTVGNTKLNVTSSGNGNDITFSWTFTVNGVEAPDKCVALRYENGFLKYFVDDWNLYEVGSTSVNLSEQEAVVIAIAQAKNYSWNAGSGNNSFGVTGFNVTNAMVIETILAPSLYADADKAHCQDLLALYPMTHVWVSLDKFYPGNVYGMDVYIWADTKEVCYIHERVSTVDPPADLVANVTAGSSGSQASFAEVKSDSLSILWIVFPAFASALLVTVPIYVRRKNSRFFGVRNLRCLKINGVLLCLLIFSPLLVVAMSASPANATPLIGRATIWGAESIGAKYTPPGWSWRKTNSEVAWQQNTSQYIAGEFASNGYYSSNFQGINSMKYEILGNISNNEALYPRVAVVDFDHGVGRTDYPLDNGQWHYLLEDDYGAYNGTDYFNQGAPHQDHIVYDMDIYNQTNGNTFFAFINTCMSANTAYGNGLNSNGKPVGMPFAWTHKMVGADTWYPPSGYMSGDGYHYPDFGNNVYIGFDGGSAALEQSITGTQWPYYYWVYHFFYYALTADYTLHQALDLASHDAFGAQYDFDQTPLYTGFTSIWPMYINGAWQNSWNGWNFSGPGSMKVYGNADLKLYQPLLTLSDGSHVGASFSIDGGYFGTGNLRITTQTHTFDVNVPTGYSFDHFYFQDTLGGTPVYYHPVSFLINHDSSLTAYYDTTITASSDAYSTITPSGVVSVSVGSSKTFTMSANTGYSITHVYVDGIDQGPISSYTFPSISSPHTISVSTGLVVGGSSTLYSVAAGAAQNFATYYNSLNLGNSVNAPIVCPGGSDDDAFRGVANGTYDIGMLDRPPTQQEWNNSAYANIQVWAIAYNGTLPPKHQDTQTLDPAKLLWLVTNGIPACGYNRANASETAKEMFISYVRNATNLLNNYQLNQTRASDIEGIPSNANYTGQTQSYPNGIINFDDVTAFVDQYIKSNMIYNVSPLGDFDADGQIDFNDVTAFVSGYIDFWSSGTNSSGGVSTGGGIGLSGLVPQPAGVVSAVQSGTLNVSSWQVGPNPYPINSTVAVDVRIDNASNVWGWHLGVNWTASTLQLTRVVEGGYLKNQDSTLFVGGSSSLFDNVNGKVNGGLGSMFMSDPEPYMPSSSGVLATLYFNVTAAGSANVTLYGATLLPDSHGNDSVTAATRNAIITINVPPPLFSDGFESGNLNAWTFSYGYPDNVIPNATNTLAHTGNWSAYFPAKSAGQYGDLMKAISAQATVNLRFYVNLASNASGYFEVAQLDASNGDYVAINLNLASGKYEVSYYNNTLSATFNFDSAPQTIPATTWTCLELAVNATRFTLYCNAAAVVTSAFPNGPTSSYNCIEMASYVLSSAGVPAYYIDDVVAATHYIGP